MTKIIAVIPARGGSKRIPRKNIRPFIGVPAIQRTIDIVQSSRIFSEIIVTTDDNEIAEISINSGAIVIERPPSLADDKTPTVPVIAHTVEKFIDKSDYENVYVCCIYPVNPFLDADDLIKGLQSLKLSEDISYVLPICSYPYPIQRAFTVSEDRSFMLQPEHALTRSQDLVEVFHDAGQWYWGRAKTWVKQDKLLINSKVIKIPRWRCQDIDTEEDWINAELMFMSNLKNNKNEIR